MAAQKCLKKKMLTEIFCIFECLLTQNPTNSRELFPPENDFQTSSTKTFPKSIQISAYVHKSV